MNLPCSYSHPMPYPAVRVLGQEASYARAMLNNLGSCTSEMTAINIYLYNSFILEKTYAEISECFRKISIVEMHHLEIFEQLALQLGADPRLWSCTAGRMTYWSPSCSCYTSQVNEMIHNALESEKEAVERYNQQIRWIKDPNITALLKRIILDEECHIKIFNSFCMS